MPTGSACCWARALWPREPCAKCGGCRGSGGLNGCSSYVHFKMGRVNQHKKHRVPWGWLNLVEVYDPRLYLYIQRYTMDLSLSSARCNRQELIMYQIWMQTTPPSDHNEPDYYTCRGFGDGHGTVIYMIYMGWRTSTGHLWSSNRYSINIFDKSDKTCL